MNNTKRKKMTATEALEILSKSWNKPAGYALTESELKAHQEAWKIYVRYADENDAKTLRDIKGAGCEALKNAVDLLREKPEDEQRALLSQMTRAQLEAVDEAVNDRAETERENYQTSYDDLSSLIHDALNGERTDAA